MLVKPVKLKIQSSVQGAQVLGPLVITPEGRVDSWEGYAPRKCDGCGKEDVTMQLKLEFTYAYYCGQCILENALLGNDE